MNKYDSKKREIYPRKKIVAKAAVIALLLGMAGIQDQAGARTKLTTLPERDFMRIDLKNKNYTLVEEERTISLQRGKNQVEFAWANTYIDKYSIQFRPIKVPGRVFVLSVNYPPGENALFWNVSADKAGPGVFRISYLLSNLHRTISYEATANTSETRLNLKSHFTLKNFSGEGFTNANLELGYGKDFKKTFQIGESKKMLSAKFTDVGLVKAFHFDLNKGKHVRLFYEIENSRKNRLGDYPLLGGKVRIFQTDPAGTEAFLGEDWGSYTGRGQKLSLFLGEAKEVKVERFLYANEVEWVDKPVHNRRQVWKYRIENFKKDAVPLVLHEHPGGEWTIEKVTLKMETGERNEKTERTVDHQGMVKLLKKDVDNLNINFKLPPTKDFKYNLYVEVLLKNIW